MTRFVALLRAVNVGRKGRLAMTDLADICRGAGLSGVETYIASGNVVFGSGRTAPSVKSLLEARIGKHMGKPVGVIVRTAREMQVILEANPFPEAPPNLAYAFFLDGPPPRDALERATGAVGERMALGVREIYVHYPLGMGRSKLRLPAVKHGTARNMNTVAALAAMAMKQ